MLPGHPPGHQEPNKHFLLSWLDCEMSLTLLMHLKLNPLLG